LKSLDVGIIGAGLTGLTCGQRLATAGHRVTLVDKGHRAGGRLATRLSDKGSFDHGAPGLQVTTRNFDIFLRECVDEERAVHIEPRSDLARLLSRNNPGAKRFYTGAPSINAICAHISARIRPLQSVSVASVSRDDLGRWLMHPADAASADTETGKPEASKPLGPFDIIVIAIPAPQAIEVLGGHAAPFEVDLAKVTYSPCMVAMLGLTTPIRNLSPVRIFNDDCLDSIIKDSATPGRNTLAQGQACYTLRATLAWSIAHQDDDKDDIAEALTGRLADLVPSVQPRLKSGPPYLEGHRWRYARVTNPIGREYLADDTNRVLVAGDFCLGPNAEHAFLSGSAAAGHVLAKLAPPN